MDRYVYMNKQAHMLRLLSCTHSCTHAHKRILQLTVRRDFELAQKKERKTAIICDETLNCNKNLAGVLLMCERHPPSRPALVQELEESIEVCIVF